MPASGDSSPLNSQALMEALEELRQAQEEQARLQEESQKAQARADGLHEELTVLGEEAVQSVHYQQEQESQYNQLQIEEAGRQQLLVGDKERQEIAQEWAQSAQVQEQGAQRQERVGESRLQEEEERLDFREEELSSLQAVGERLELYYQQVVEEGQAWEDEELEEIGPLLDLKG